MAAESSLQERLVVHVQEGEPPPEIATLAAETGASFFQTPSWMRAVQQADSRLHSVCILAQDTTGDRLEAVCPLFAVRRLGTVRLYAGAWGTYGGILARSSDAARAVRTRLEQLARSPRTLVVRVHDFQRSFDAGGDLAPLWRRTPETAQVLDLPGDPQVLFSDAFTSQNRNKIRKAEKAGVRVRRASEPQAFATYVELYRESARRWGSPGRLPQPMLRALSTVEHGVDLWLAERDDEAIAALLNFTFGGQVMNWGNVSRHDAWRYAPNNLLHWRALEHACRDTNGPRLYNFGSSANLPNVRAFKSSFGARDFEYASYEARARWVGWLRR